MRNQQTSPSHDEDAIENALAKPIIQIMSLKPFFEC